jgi:LPXTG-motif cell wall-anchored protein
VSQVLLRRNYVAGQPGLMDAFPPMNFAVFTPGQVKPGNYRLGIACTYFRATDRYWDVPIVITAASGDKPAGFQWRTLDSPATADTSSGGNSTWLYVGGAAMIAALLVMFFVRRRRVRAAIAVDGSSSYADKATIDSVSDSKPDSYSNPDTYSYSTTSTTTHPPEDLP